MQPFTSKELYMMNGGNKLYIHTDGFGDVYNATPEEEAVWAQEVIANALATIDTAQNPIELEGAVKNLLFHNYKGVQQLLLSKMQDASAVRKAALASILLTLQKQQRHAEAADADPVFFRAEDIDDYFQTMRTVRNKAAKRFLLKCLEGTDHELAVKATIALEIWAYSGMPALRQNNLLQLLQPENKYLPEFKTAIEQLRLIFQLPNNT